MKGGADKVGKSGEKAYGNRLRYSRLNRRSRTSGIGRRRSFLNQLKLRYWAYQ